MALKEKVLDYDPFAGTQLHGAPAAAGTVLDYDPFADTERQGAPATTGAVLDYDPFGEPAPEPTKATAGTVLDYDPFGKPTKPAPVPTAVVSQPSPPVGPTPVKPALDIPVDREPGLPGMVSLVGQELVTGTLEVPKQVAAGLVSGAIGTTALAGPGEAERWHEGTLGMVEKDLNRKQSQLDQALRRKEKGKATAGAPLAEMSALKTVFGLLTGSDLVEAQRKVEREFEKRPFSEVDQDYINTLQEDVTALQAKRESVESKKTSAAGIRQEMEKQSVAGWLMPPPEMHPAAWVARIITQAIPGMAAAVGAAATTGNPWAAGLILGNIQGLDVYFQARQKGMPINEANRLAFLEMILSTAIEQQPFANLVRGLDGRIVTRFLKQGTFEGLEEILDQAKTNFLIKHGGVDAGRKAWEGLLESFIGGFGAGGMFGALSTKPADQLTPIEVDIVNVMRKMEGQDRPAVTPPPEAIPAPAPEVVPAPVPEEPLAPTPEIIPPGEKPPVVKFLEGELPSKIWPELKKMEFKIGDYTGEVNPQPIVKKTALQKDPVQAIAGLASTESDRLVLNGVLLDPAEGVAVATDGRGLVQMAYTDKKKGVIAPKRIKVRPEIGKPGIDIAKGKTIEGDFPNYKQAIPQDLTEYTFVNVGDAEAVMAELCGVERANKFLKKSYQIPEHVLVDIPFRDVHMVVSAMRLNAVLTALRKTGAKNIEIGIKNADEPLYIKTENPKTLGVLMPLRGGEGPSFGNKVLRVFEGVPEAEPAIEPPIVEPRIPGAPEVKPPELMTMAAYRTAEGDRAAAVGNDWRIAADNAVGKQRFAVKTAFENKRPILAETWHRFRKKMPPGYVREGVLYVSKVAPAPGEVREERTAAARIPIERAAPPIEDTTDGAEQEAVRAARAPNEEQYTVPEIPRIPRVAAAERDPADIEELGIPPVISPAVGPLPAVTVQAWTRESGELRSGRRLIRRIRKDVMGSKAGVRSIVEFVNNLVDVEMRRSKSQTSKRYPANYRPSSHLVFTQGENVQIDFHEAGHGLRTILTDERRRWIQGYGADFIALTQMPGSVASAKNTSEGVAEWVRRFVVDYDSIRDHAVTPFLEEYLARTHPSILAGLRDANRAYYEHMQRSPIAQFASFSRDIKPPRGKTFRSLTGWAGYTIARGHATTHLERGIFRAIKHAEGRRSENLKVARNWRKQIGVKILTASQNLLMIPSEIVGVYQGQVGARSGVRVIDSAGKYVYFSNQSVVDIYAMVGKENRQAFEDAGWALTALDRYNKKKLDYPGRLDGIPPATLRGIVQRARKEIPNFDKAYQAVTTYADALLDVAVLGGEKTPKEAQHMKDAYEYYWPLPRLLEAGKVGAGRRVGGPSSGFMRAHGSLEGIESLAAALEKRTTDVLRAYYWNQAMLRTYDALEATARNKALPFEVRKMAGRTLVPLRLDSKKVAGLGKQEVLPIIADYVNQTLKRQLKRPLQLGEIMRPDDVNLVWKGKDIWRKVAPGEVNIIAPIRDGKRIYMQVADPILFHMFGRAENPGMVAQGLQEIIVPVTANWKRPVTQNIVFAAWNTLVRDPANAVLMGEGPEGYLFGAYILTGLMNRISGKNADVKQLSELYSRQLDQTTKGLAGRLQRSEFLSVLMEGWYESRVSSPTLRMLINVIHPANWLNVVTKPIDIANYVTGQRKIAQLGEETSREGAAIWARKHGGTDEDVARAYQITTGNFGERSGFADLQAWVRMPGFLNPGLQIIYRRLLGFFDPDPAVVRQKLVRLGISGLYSAIGWAVKEILSDERDREREKERPDVDRAAYMDFKGLRFPFEYGEIGLTQSLVWNTLDVTVGGRPLRDRKKFAKQLLTRAIDFPGNPLALFNPQLKALIEAKVNYVFFFDKHIESAWLESLPAAERYRASTPEFYRKLGDMAGWSPLRIQHFVRSGLVRQLDDTVRLVDNMQRGVPIQEAADYPFIGRLFIRDPIGWRSASVMGLGDYARRWEALNRQLQNLGYDLNDPSTLNGMPVSLYRQVKTLQALNKELLIIRRQSEFVKHLEDIARGGSVTPRMRKILGDDFIMNVQLGSIPKEDLYSYARNIQSMMVRQAQSALAASPHANTLADQAEQYLESLTISQ